MNDDSIATRIFADFYKKYREEGYEQRTILFNLLPQFVEEIATSWREDCSIGPVVSYELIDNSKPFFEVDTSDFKKTIVITENGKIYYVKRHSFKSGGYTWNGDDEYFENMGCKYLDPIYIDSIENISEITEQCDLTSEKMENIACEIVSTICQ